MVEKQVVLAVFFNYLMNHLLAKSNHRIHIKIIIIND